MPEYNSRWFEPPAPIARVTLRNRDSGVVVVDVPMLLDTGADVTLLPQTAVDELGLVSGIDKHYELVGFDGSTSISPVVQLDLVFLDRTFRGQFLLIDQEWGILGRNILNALSLLLNGPRLTWDETKRK